MQNHIETLLTRFCSDQQRMNVHYKQIIGIIKQKDRTIEKLQNQVDELSILVNLLNGERNDDVPF